MNNELGEKLYGLQSKAVLYKEVFNELKLALGMTLNELEALYEDECLDGNPDFDEDDVTFNQFLASIHLNKRRVIQMKRNAKYVRELEIDTDEYKYLDSSLIDLCRKEKVNPVDYKDNSYSDVCKTIKTKSDGDEW